MPANFPASWLDSLHSPLLAGAKGLSCSNAQIAKIKELVSGVRFGVDLTPLQLVRSVAALVTYQLNIA